MCTCQTSQLGLGCARSELVQKAEIQSVYSHSRQPHSKTEIKKLNLNFHTFFKRPLLVDIHSVALAVHVRSERNSCVTNEKGELEKFKPWLPSHFTQPG